MRLKDRIAAAARSLALATLLLPATPAHAGLRFAGIDGIFSTVMQHDQTSFSGTGLRVRVRSDALVPQLVFLPTMEYWRTHMHLDSYDITTTSSDATLGMDVRWEFTAGSTHPYLGAGLALHFLSSQVTSPPLGLDESSSSIPGGPALLGGLGFPIAGKLENFIELKWHKLPDADQFKINWGLAYNF
jgi:hypothetical protein